MTIRWYPGHMGKALEEIQELIKKVDVVIEVLDARLPYSSANHKLAAIRWNKPWIKVLNKHDLADPAVTKAWVRDFEKQSGMRALPMSAKKHGDTKPLIRLCQLLAPKRGKPGLPVRTMVVGIPNVGKSTLINTLAGKSMAKVGDRPAVTTTTQRIDLHNGVVLSDTPGVLWPDMSDQEGAYRLAASGAIGDNAMDYTEVGLFAGEYLLQALSRTAAGALRPDGAARITLRPDRGGRPPSRTAGHRRSGGPAQGGRGVAARAAGRQDRPDQPGRT